VNQTIGTCSLCGGRVTLPTVWHGVAPPTPTCESCHATAKSHGPTIEMERPRTARNVMIAADGKVYPVK